VSHDSIGETEWRAQGPVRAASRTWWFTRERFSPHPFVAEPLR
jgi:hypothetical protein